MSKGVVLSQRVFNELISNALEIESKGQVPEVEIRFKSYTYDKQGYNNRIFNKLLGKFKKLDIQESEIHIRNNLRKEIYNNDIKYVEKLNYYSSFNKEYNLKYTVNSEKELPDVTKDFVPSVTRKRKRYSYKINDKFRLDMTKINNGETNEIELELLDFRNIEYNDFFSTIVQVLRLINDTFIPYSVSEKEEIINFYNQTVKSNYSSPILDHRQLVQARNLKFEDVQYGGLVGNQKTAYTVTVKADGERYQMIFHTSGLYLVRPPEEVILLTKLEFSNFSGMILDGELIPKEKRKGNHSSIIYVYLAFDCIAVPGGKTEFGDIYVQKLTYMERIKFAQAGVNQIRFRKLPSNLIMANTKFFRTFITVDEFFRNMEKIKSMEQILDYETDGFLFTPYGTEYNPHSERVSYRDRVLLNYPDICKLKPLELLTIDFAVKENKAYSLDKDGSLILFEGDKFNPINQENDFDWDNKLLLDIPDGTIVEFYWKPNSVIESRYKEHVSLGKFVPLRIRNDKERPNSYDPVALNNWKDINSGITYEVLKPDNLTLMKKYHNRIKKYLFEKAYQIVSLRTGKKMLNLLDLGSGAGGDIMKWQGKFSKVLAVDPNVDNLREFRKRAEKTNGIDITVLQAGAEDTEEITKIAKDMFEDKADVVSSMLSMSFLWESEEKVKAFIQTIKQNLAPHGIFIFFTINGDLINEMIKPSFELGLEIGETIKLGNIHLNFLTDRKYEVVIPDSIVGTQTEYKVFLDDLTTGFSPEMFLAENNIADSEKLLASGQYEYSKLFSYGYYDYNKILKDNLNITKVI
jgi:SAM-dependent methyltransferase